MEKNNQLKLEKKNFYKIYDIVDKYDYRRYQRGGGKYVKYLEDKIIEDFIKLTELENAPLLDCPCGTGRAIPIVKKFTHNITCVDTSDEMLSYSKNKFSEIIFMNSSADKLNVQSNSIEIYTSIRFFFHFENLDNFFLEANRVLKNGGYYIFDVFNWSPRTLFKNSFIGGKTFNHRKDYIDNLCQKNNFQLIKLQKCFFIPTYISTFLPNIFVMCIEYVVDKIFFSKLSTKTFYLLKKIK